MYKIKTTPSSKYTQASWILSFQKKISCKVQCEYLRGPCHRSRSSSG